MNDVSWGWQPKRGRGRPPKSHAYKGGGLFNAFLREEMPERRRAGRPEHRWLDEKRQFVADFAEMKARLRLTASATATALAERFMPQSNSYTRRRKAGELVRLVRRLRAELKIR